MPDSISLRMNMNCRSCQISNPVNGIADAYTCYHCGERNQLDLKFWSWFLHPEVWQLARRGRPGEEGRRGRIMPVCWVFFASSAPRCQGCKTELPTEMLGPHVAAGRCFCPACGRPIRLRAAGELVRALDESARILVGETIDAPFESAKSPLVFGCMVCAAPLRVDGTSRSCVCEHCDASNYLPDGLWQKLHPVPKPHDFYVVFR